MEERAQGRAQRLVWRGPATGRGQVLIGNAQDTETPGSARGFGLSWPEFPRAGGRASADNTCRVRYAPGERDQHVSADALQGLMDQIAVGAVSLQVSPEG